jgi:hypothetical protein
MAQSQLTKIYELRSIGYEELQGQLTNINTAFSEIRKNKEALNKMAGKGSRTSEELEKERQATEKLRVEEQELRNQRLKMQNEAKAWALLQQQEKQRLQEQARFAKVAAGSYNELYLQYRELYKLVKAAPAGGQVTFLGNTLQYDQAIKKLQELAAAEQNFRRQFQRDGLLVGEYTSGIVQAFKSMGLDDLIGGQITKAKTRLTDLNSEFNKLQQELSETKVAGDGSLQAIERMLIENRKEAIALTQQVGKLEAEFRGTGDVGNQITASLAAGFKDAKNQLSNFVLGYVGFQAALGGVQRAIDLNAELSDKFVDLQRILGITEEATAKVVNSLKQIDSRTSLQGLTDIAIIAAKAGVAAEDIDGVTAAIDQLVLVAGKELGDVEKSTESLVKLVNIFSEDGKVTGDAVRSIGNGLVELANAGVASGGFLIDFSQRLAGVAGTANISLDSVLGLAAGFEELGQSSEVSSGAVVQVLSKIGQDVPKYAKLAGKSVEEFTQTLRTAPQEALLQLAENLGGNGGAFDELSKNFADAEARGIRVIQTLGVLGANADTFRAKIKLAGGALADTNAIVDGANQKQQTFGATVDKIRKQFELLGNNKAVQALMLAVAGSISLLIANLPTLLVLLGALAVNWAIQNANLLLLNASMIGYNLLIARNYVLMGLLTPLLVAQKIALFLLNGAYTLVTAAASRFNIVIGRTPLGLILTGITLLTAATVAYGNSLNAASNRLREQNRQARIMNELQNEARKSVTETIAKEQTYLSIIRDNTLALGTRQRALNELIALNPEYLKGLTLENIEMDKGRAILEKYNEALYAKALAEAAAARSSREFQKLVSLQTLQQDVQFALKTGKGLDLSDIDTGILDQLAETTDTPFLNSLFLAAAKGIGASLDNVSQLRDLDKILQANINEQQQIVNDVEKNKLLIDKALGKPTTDKKTGGGRVVTDEEKKTGKRRADRLDVDIQNQFKDIDALRDEALAKERQRRLKDEIDEETYLRNILVINQQAIDKKLALLKARNSEERKQYAELSLNRIEQEQETNEAIFKLRERAARQLLDAETSQAESSATVSLQDPNLSSQDRAGIEVSKTEAILAAQVKFNETIDQLEKEFTQISRENADKRKAAILAIEAELRADRIALATSQLQDIDRAEKRQLTEYEIYFSKIRQAILENDELTEEQRKFKLDEVNRTETRTILSAELAKLNIEVAKKKQLLQQGLISQDEYLDAVKRQQQKAEELAADYTLPDAQRPEINGVQGALQIGVRKLSGFKAGSNEDKMLADAITASYNLATDAMNGYFDAERSRIEDSLSLAIERLDIEQEQVMNLASSKAEQEAIEKQYAAKKRKLEQEAFEKTKETKRKEAKIAFLMELANIWSSVWSIGNPIVAAIMGAVLSGLAIARYANTVSQINQQKFEFGGKPGDVPTQGGKFGGQPHSKGGTPFTFKGQSYEAEVDELAVIRTRNAPKNRTYNISGTQSQIASKLNELGGGVAFDRGARLNKFEYGGQVGERLQAPVFVPSAVSLSDAAGNQTAEILDTMREQAMAIQAVSNQVRTLQVVQRTSTVTEAQDKEVKQIKTGTL